MTSWVRYSVATYVGLLAAGSLVLPQHNASAQDLLRPVAVPHSMTPIAPHPDADDARQSPRFGPPRPHSAPATP